MRTPLNQTGASHLVAVLAVVIIAAIGVIGFKVMNANSDDTAPETASSSQTLNTSDEATIKSRADVQQVSKDLDNTSLNEVDPSQFDSDLNSIL